MTLIFNSMDVQLEDIGEFMENFASAKSSPCHLLLDPTLRKRFASSHHWQMVSGAWSYHQQNLQSGQVNTCGGFQRFHHRGSKCTPSGRLEADLMKLIGNSSYGKTIMDTMKHCDLCFADEHQIRVDIMDPNVYNVSELERGFYKAEKNKQELLLDLLVHIIIFILNYAKLHLLQFYCNVTDQSTYEINNTDTNSLYLSLIENSVEELVPPEEKQTFEAEKHLWLVTSQVHQGKRAPGLCSKSYCIKGTDNGTVKVSIKGVNKSQFHYIFIISQL